MKRIKKRSIKDLSNHFLYPRKCPACGIVLPAGELVCAKCREEIRLIGEPTCMQCGRHIEDEGAELCPTCAGSDRSNIFGLAVFAYDDIMRRVMSDLKFHDRMDNADYLAAMAVSRFGQRIRSFDPCALIPVPVHRSRLRSRGFNQSEVICQKISELLGTPVVSDLLLRVRKTDYQKNLDRILRKRNLEGAFSCDSERYPKERVKAEFPRVLLVDDIYTTGSTMEHCSAELIAAGVGEVGLLSICIGK